MLFTAIITGSGLLKVASRNPNAAVIYLIFVLSPAAWSVFYITRDNIKEQFR